MDRVNIFLSRQIDNFVNAQIGIDRSLALADLVGLVSLVTMQRQLVFF